MIAHVHVYHYRGISGATRSNKVWCITRPADDDAQFVAWGAFGKRLSVKLRDDTSAAFDKLINSKEAKGYQYRGTVLVDFTNIRVTESTIAILCHSEVLACVNGTNTTAARQPMVSANYVPKSASLMNEVKIDGLSSQSAYF